MCPRGSRADAPVHGRHRSQQPHQALRRPVAVDDVSFTVEEGEIFGILGPNGAGQDHHRRVVAGLRTPGRGHRSASSASTPGATGPSCGPKVGVQLQESELPDRMTVGEALDAVRLVLRRAGRHRARCSTTSGSPTSATRPTRLSGGQKQRLSIALALVGKPQVAILDELTTGLDPQARRDTWQLIESIRDRGVTVLLVTHFMEEAERLCDRVAVIGDGPGRRARHARRARARWSTRSSGSGSGRPRRWTTGCSPTCRRSARVERTGPIRRRHRHRQPPAAVTSVLARHQVVANDLRDRAGQPRRRLRRADRPRPARTAKELS